MAEYRFEAMGTVWSVVVADEQATDQKLADLWQEILIATNKFDQQFSRFIPTSEACAWQHALPGTYSISAEMCTLLKVANQLRELTAGAYDPAIGGLLEIAGYDNKYSLQPQVEKIQSWQLPNWSLDDKKGQITIDDGIVFDLGGMAKGYWVDKIAKLVKSAGWHHYLVDGSGDMVGTSKVDGSGWQIGVQWPGDKSRVLSLVELKNSGLAVSDVFGRRWRQDWHHLVNATTARPQKQAIGIAAAAPTAWLADQATAALGLVAPARLPIIAQALTAEYVVITANQTAHISPGWPGELF